MLRMLQTKRDKSIRISRECTIVMIVLNVYCIPKMESTKKNSKHIITSQQTKNIYSDHKRNEMAHVKHKDGIWGIKILKTIIYRHGTSTLEIGILYMKKQFYISYIYMFSSFLYTISSRLISIFAKWWTSCDFLDEKTKITNLNEWKLSFQWISPCYAQFFRYSSQIKAYSIKFHAFLLLLF